MSRIWGVIMSTSFLLFPIFRGREEKQQSLVPQNDVWLERRRFWTDHTSEATLGPTGNSAPWPKRSRILILLSCFSLLCGIALLFLVVLGKIYLE